MTKKFGEGMEMSNINGINQLQKKKIPATKNHSFDDVIKQGYCHKLANSLPDAIIGGLYIYDSTDAQPYAEKLKKEVRGKNLSVSYMARLLDMWHRACQLFHITTDSCLADDIFTVKKINYKSYYYKNNISNFISDEILNHVKENHRSYSRKAVEEKIREVENEFNTKPDMYYYALDKLGWKKAKRNYLVRAIAGALSSES